MKSPGIFPWTEIPTKPSSHVGQPGLESPHPSSYLLSLADCPGLPPSLDCRPPALASVGCPVLCPGLFCFFLCSASFSDLVSRPFFPRPLPVSWGISRASPLYGFRAKTDKGIFWQVLTHTHTTNAHIVSHIHFWTNTTGTPLFPQLLVK